MSDYISREAAKKKHCEICKDNNVCYRSYDNCKEVKAFDLIKAADVVEQKHGKWKKAYLDHEAFGIRPTVVYCSECNLVGYWEPKYCPNCGARMDGDDDV